MIDRILEWFVLYEEDDEEDKEKVNNCKCYKIKFDSIINNEDAILKKVFWKLMRPISLMRK